MSLTKEFYLLEHRQIDCDAEDLAEGQVERILEDAADRLHKFGVSLANVESVDSGSDYAVRVNGKTYPILPAGEANHMQGWGHAHLHFVEMMNDLLAKAEADEHAFAIYGGNDAGVVMLTPDEKRVICESAGYRDLDRPMPVEELRKQLAREQSAS